MDWLVIPKQLHVEALAVQDGVIAVTASTESPTAACPICRQPSSRVHSIYRRVLADLPWAGTPVRLHLTVRKFYCDNPLCSRKIFVERLRGVAQPYAHRTDRQREDLQSIGWALGGEAGARLAADLGMFISADTLLRYVKALPEIPSEPIRVLGIDDWSWRRGTRFGTILVDLERHRIADLLPDREADSVADWLGQHPEVEIISRDRYDAYAEAATRGAPQAIQVADRWHLLHNLLSYLERFLLHHSRTLKEVAPLLAETAAVERPPPRLRPAPREAVLDEAGEHRHSKYVELWERIHELHAVGADLADIARRLSISRRTVYRYLARPEPPPRRRIAKRRRKLVEPYREYLVRRWNDGCHNKSRLFREVRDRGYRYSQSNIMRFLAQLERGDPDAGSCTHGPAAPGIRPRGRLQGGNLVCEPVRDLSEKQSKYLAEVCQQAEEIRKARDLTGEFCAMLRALKGERLDEWMAKAEGSGVVELQRFALSLKKDLDAVRAGLTLEFSQGQTEGQVNKLKLLKRQSYGRAGFSLLRKRTLKAA